MSRSSGSHRRRRRMERGINLTPMLDMIFNLIFFFILATNIKSETNQIKVNIPHSSQGQVAPTSDQVPVITLMADGKVGYQGREMVDEELQLELQAMAKRGIHKVRIAGDSQATYGRYVEVMTYCLAAGIDDVSLPVKAPKER